MPDYRLSPAAERDIETILAWTHEQFGERARLRYEALLVRAMLDIATDPERPGCHSRPELAPGALTYHLVLQSRPRAEIDGTRSPSAALSALPPRSRRQTGDQPRIARRHGSRPTSAGRVPVTNLQPAGHPCVQNAGIIEIPAFPPSVQRNAARALSTSSLSRPPAPRSLKTFVARNMLRQFGETWW